MHLNAVRKVYLLLHQFPDDTANNYIQVCLLDFFFLWRIEESEVTTYQMNECTNRTEIEIRSKSNAPSLSVRVVFDILAITVEIKYRIFEQRAFFWLKLSSQITGFFFFRFVHVNICCEFVNIYEHITHTSVCSSSPTFFFCNEMSFLHCARTSVIDTHKVNDVIACTCRKFELCES